MTHFDTYQNYHKKKCNFHRRFSSRIEIPLPLRASVETLQLKCVLAFWFLTISARQKTKRIIVNGDTICCYLQKRLSLYKSGRVLIIWLILLYFFILFINLICIALKFVLFLSISLVLCISILCSAHLLPRAAVSKFFRLLYH